MSDNSCNNSCKLVSFDDKQRYKSASIKCGTTNNKNIINPDRLINKEKCIYKKYNDAKKGLEIDPSSIYLESSNNCWGYSNKMESSNNMGIIDKVNGQYVKKCCNISNFVIPHNKITPNEVLFSKCKILNKDNIFEMDDSKIPTLSEICKHNSDSNIENSKETINLCNKYKCCSKHNDEYIV